MQAFKSELASLETVVGVAQRVFSQYDYDGAYADVLLTTIQSVHSATTLTRGDLIRFIERGIEDGSTHEVHPSAGTTTRFTASDTAVRRRRSIASRSCAIDRSKPTANIVERTKTVVARLTIVLLAFATIQMSETLYPPQ
jgi:hypothetical protein